MSRTCNTAQSPRWWGVLLACFALSCSVPDGLMLNIHVPENTPVKSYVIKLQERETRKVVFLSGLQKVVARDLNAQPLRVAMPFSQHGKFLLQVLAANVDNVEALPQAGVNEPQLFFAKILEVAALQELDVPLLPVAPEFDTDGDHFPDSVRWLAALPAAEALYKDTPEVLDCVDGDPPAGDIVPVRTRGFDIHPLAQTQCNVTLRPPHSPTANPLPDRVPLDVSCAGMPRICADKDGDGDPEGSDCDDLDVNRFHGNPRPRNCCQCTDPKSCASNHAKLANLKLCTPKRCDTATDYDCTGLSVDCFTDEDCDGYSPTDPDPRLRDCDDNDVRVHPNADKICDPEDGVIKDWACDGRPQVGCVPCDLDGDGFQRAEVIGTQTCPTKNYKASGRAVDCDDNDRGVFPGALIFKGSATKFSDLDGSSRGYNVLSAMRGLCRNNDPTGQPQNTGCDTNLATARSGCPSAACDADGDGFPANLPTCLVVGKPVDCNDNDPTIFPGAPLHCDGKDHDCDGTPDPCSVDRDGDGYAASGDCDDGNAAVHPFANEMCNGRDDDCDGLVDEQNPDPAGSQLIQQAPDGTTRIASCADSTVGLCGQKDAKGYFSGRCVCTTVTPNSTLNPAAIAACPGEVDTSPFTPRCFGANQPKPQSCDADVPIDDDCNGSLSDVAGTNLAVKGQTCGLTVAGTKCKAGTVVGCDRSKENPFYTLKVPGFANKDRYLVCKSQIDPTPEVCNGYDDDCNNIMPLDEQDTDKDAFLACTGCSDATINKDKFLFCNDCDDNDNKVYPAVAALMYLGAPELCDGRDNKCVSGNVSTVPANDGMSQCGNMMDVGKPFCCSGLRMCIDPMTDFSHCGSCTNACSNSTADRCTTGSCYCSGDMACDLANTAKSMCLAGKGCVQCLATPDCKRLLGNNTPTSACNLNTNLCVECTDNSFCGGASPICDMATNRCVPCLSNTNCTAANAKACRKDPGGDSTKNLCVQCTDKTTCNASNPACDTQRNVCVPCVAGADCPMATPQCKPDAGGNSSLNSCVECLISANCKNAALPACYAMTNHCVPCLGDGDCGAGKRCLIDPSNDPARNSCVQCLSGADCMAAKPTCNAAIHQCVSCDASPDCSGMAGKPVCSVYQPADPTKNQCVACLAKADCMNVSGKPGCYADPAMPANNQCVVCVNNNDCAAPIPICKVDNADPSKDVCLVCLQNTDCASPKGVCAKDKDDDVKNVCAACAKDNDCVTMPNIYCKVKATDQTQNQCVACTEDNHCSGATPRCNLASNTCVACLAMGDCNAPKPQCNTNINMCVACLADNDCNGTPATPKCNTTNNMCVGCVTNTDCNGTPLTPSCNPTTNTCVACLSNTDCSGMPATPKCNLTKLMCVACLGNSDCSGTPTTPKCEMTKNMCVSCLNDVDCSGTPMTPKCDMTKNTCAACLNDVDCSGTPMTPKCDVTKSMCVSCLNDGDCMGTPATPKCEMTKHMCVACLNDGNCMGTPTTPKCNTTKNMCVACLNDGDCMGTPATPKCNATKNMCVACLNDGDCMGTPTTPKCNAVQNMCVACLNDGDCMGTPTTPKCENTGHMCVECVLNSDCPLGPKMCDVMTHLCMP